MSNRWRTTAAYSAALALTATGLATSAVAQPADSNAAAPTDRAAPAAESGYRSVGYFTQWGIYGRDFMVNDLDASGAAQDLTHINYAFANIHPDSLTCFEANQPNGAKDSPTEGDYAGDAWADYGRGFSAAESVDGEADTWDQPLAGNFNQIKELKAKHPHLKAMVSIGGWTWSRHFSRAAATPESRETFVSSCIDMFIKGNLPVIDGRGGDGAAAEVFDGIDIDWEWPGAPADKQHPGNHRSDADKENLVLLLAEFRSQLDELSAETGDDYELSAFLPADPVLIEAGWDVSQLFDYLDFGNVQGYDLHGTWNPDTAGHQANLYDDPANPLDEAQQFSVDAAMTYYTDHGVPASKLTMGIPLYGRGWTGVEDGGTHGAWQSASGAAPGEFPEEAGTDRYRNLRDGTIFHDEQAMASWSYDGTQFWSFDDPWLVNRKADYIEAGGFGGAMWWDLAGDYENELVGLMGERLATGGGGDGGDEPGDDEPGDDSGGQQDGAWLTGYWHNFDNGSTVLEVSDVPAAYNLLAIAFADSVAGSPGSIEFNLDTAGLGGYTVDEFKADVAERQAAGGTVVISVGGQNGHVSVTNATEAANFAQSTHALMQEYGFDGVDIDLEHGIDATYMEQALRQLRDLAGPDLIITMAPQTIDFQAPSYAYYQLALGIQDILTIVNMQYYNSGSMLGCDQQVYAQGTVDFLTAQACIQLQAGLDPDQVGLGLPAVPSAAGGGYQPADNVTAALDCLATASRCGAFVPDQPWGPIGGAMTWSVNWDATNGFEFANVVGSYLGTG